MRICVLSKISIVVETVVLCSGYSEPLDCEQEGNKQVNSHKGRTIKVFARTKRNQFTMLDIPLLTVPVAPYFY